MKTLIVMFILTMLCGVACAEIPTDIAIRALIGEDSSSYRGMYAVACAMRNREANGIDSLKNIYGAHAVRWEGGLLKRFKGKKVVEVIDGDLYQMASKAWAESEDGPDITNGADHWEGISFPKPKWASKMVDCGVFGENHFYKARKG